MCFCFQMDFSLERVALHDLSAKFHDNWVYYNGREDKRNEFKKINLNDGHIVNLKSIPDMIK